jgi:phytoene dehydrogenase-like protein
MDRLEQHLLGLSPADAAVIKEFTDAVRSRADWQKIMNPDPQDKYNTMTDPTMCPAGKSVVVSLMLSDYEYWEQLNRQDREAYRAEKQRLGAAVCAAIEKRFPVAQGKIEVMDVATPLTYHRYTGTWKGVYMGWLDPGGELPVTLPGLQGFYLAGQWTGKLSGLPTALMTGQGSIRRICQEDGKEFVEER